MRLLVIDTATRHLSLALFVDGVLAARDHRLLGRGHAEALLPAIAALPDGGRADRIRVSCGPGSFTGIRVGIAAARALAFGWGASCEGYATLALVRANARASTPTIPADAAIAVAVDGGHGEWFLSDDGAQSRSCTPADAAQHCVAHYVAGERADDLVALRGWGQALTGEADVGCALLLPANALMAHPSPLYGRAPDARPATRVSGAAAVPTA